VEWDGVLGHPAIPGRTEGMSTDISAIREAARKGWRRPGDGLGGWAHDTLAEQFGLPSGVIRVSNCGQGVEGEFLSGPLCGVKSGEEPTRTKAAVRLIVEAREYLRRESDAKSVSA
jgi:hypothetical protein